MQVKLYQLKMLNKYKYRNNNLNNDYFFKIIIIFMIVVIPVIDALALGVDKKLTLTILDVSNSKKTILVNKGSEDNLKLKDQAKFSNEGGVFARGILNRLSPHRSIWSLFKVFSKDLIEKNYSCILKIANPVKVTKDKTRSLGIFSNINSSSNINQKNILESSFKLRKFKTNKKNGKIIFKNNVNYSRLEIKSKTGILKKRNWNFLRDENKVNPVDKKYYYNLIEE